MMGNAGLVSGISTICHTGPLKRHVPGLSKHCAIWRPPCRPSSVTTRRRCRTVVFSMIIAARRITIIVMTRVTRVITTKIKIIMVIVMIIVNQDNDDENDNDNDTSVLMSTSSNNNICEQ